MRAILLSLYSHPSILSSSTRTQFLKRGALSSVSQTKRSRSCWNLTNSQQSQEKAVVFQQLMALLHCSFWYTSPGLGPVHEPFKQQYQHGRYCGSVSAKGNLQCNPNISIEAPSSQCSELAFNTALHSRNYWLEKTNKCQLAYTARIGNTHLAEPKWVFNLLQSLPELKV